jgi:hypothetical protein
MVVPASAAAAPSKNEFIRKGDALCLTMARQLQPLRVRAEAAKSLPEAQKWAATTAIWVDQVRLHSQFVAKFQAIGVPAGDATARSLVRGLGEGLVLAKRVRDGFINRNASLLQYALPQYLRLTVALNRRVAGYGFKICGRS